MGKRYSKTVVNNETQTPETKIYKYCKYSKTNHGNREKFVNTTKETVRTIKTHNLQEHSSNE